MFLNNATKRHTLPSLDTALLYYVFNVDILTFPFFFIVICIAHELKFAFDTIWCKVVHDLVSWIHDLFQILQCAVSMIIETRKKKKKEELYSTLSLYTRRSHQYLHKKRDGLGLCLCSLSVSFRRDVIPILCHRQFPLHPAS